VSDSKEDDARNDGIRFPYNISSFLIRDGKEQDAYLEGSAIGRSLYPPEETKKGNPFIESPKEFLGALLILGFFGFVVIPIGRAVFEWEARFENYAKRYVGGMELKVEFPDLKQKRMFPPIGRQTDVMLSGNLINIRVGFELKNIYCFTRCKVIERLSGGQVKVVIPAKEDQPALTLDVPKAYLTPYKTREQIEQRAQSLKVKNGTKFAIVIRERAEVEELVGKRPFIGKRPFRGQLPVGTKVKVLDVYSTYSDTRARILAPSFSSRPNPNPFAISPDDLMAIPANEYNEKEKYKSDLRSEFHQSSAVYVSNKAGSGFVASAPDARGYRTVTTFSPSRSTLG